MIECGYYYVQQDVLQDPALQRGREDGMDAGRFCKIWGARWPFQFFILSCFSSRLGGRGNGKRERKGNLANLKEKEEIPSSLRKP